MEYKMIVFKNGEVAGEMDKLNQSNFLKIREIAGDDEILVYEKNVVGERHRCGVYKMKWKSNGVIDYMDKIEKDDIPEYVRNYGICSCLQ